MNYCCDWIDSCILKHENIGFRQIENRKMIINIYSFYHNYYQRKITINVVFQPLIPYSLEYLFESTPS